MTLKILKGIRSNTGCGVTTLSKITRKDMRINADISTQEKYKEFAVASL